MKSIVFVLFTCWTGNLFSQELDTVKAIETNIVPHSFESTGGLVSYYFLEEDSLGNILNNNKLNQPYLQNYYISKSTKKESHTIIEYPQLASIVNAFAHVKTVVKVKRHFELKENGKKTKINYPLVREEATSIGSMAFIKKGSKWSCEKSGSVQYFTILSDNQWIHSKSSDSIILEKNNIKFESNGHYTVLRYLKEGGKIGKELVYTYSGIDVTNYILETKSMLPQRVLVFANGYRGPTTNKDETDHLVTNKDRYHYWYKLDDQFIDQLQPAETYYIDGSMGINTSNHKTMLNFAVSYFRSTFVFRKKWAKKKYNALNTNVNIEGFQTRKERGKIAGKAFLTALCNSPACQNTLDTIDIVCHSMGYAYTLGFIEEIKTKVAFGNIYILAPENGCLDGTDWAKFQQVWQYGSNLDQENPDPIWEQDGVAPQCQVKGIEKMKPGKGGRAFIPKDWPRKNFVDSHQPYNFYWIFERIKVGENGYVGK